MKDVELIPYSTEKNVRTMELENQLVFIVSKKANKTMIKEKIEEEFQVKVKSVNVLHDTKGRKKAFVKLKPEHSAADIAAKIGML